MNAEAACILVVEDNDDNRELILKVLELHGYRAIGAADGAAALAAVEYEVPDLILMDINLPDMDGLDVTRIIRGREGFDQVPIVALTGYAMAGDRDRSIDAGCSEYIAKPINVRTFPRVIERLLAARAKH
ncbi:MAG: response regulator [Deltaproteobacteria bacterium]|nr:response regulator [Candidatus Anaeroferrophillacea bacterium]